MSVIEFLKDRKIGFTLYLEGSYSLMYIYATNSGVWGVTTELNIQQDGYENIIKDLSEHFFGAEIDFKIDNAIKEVKSGSIK